jgi:hypothetical protein
MIDGRDRWCDLIGLSVAAIVVVSTGSARADIERGTAAIVGRGCWWFAMEDDRTVGSYSMVEQLSGNLPAVGERVQIDRDNPRGRRVDDRFLTRDSAIRRLRDRCARGVEPQE